MYLPMFRNYDEAFFEDGGLQSLSNWLARNATNCPELSQTFRFASCISRPSKIICIGLNYSKHAAESGMELPSEPVIFFKATSALCGPNDPVIIPRNSKKTDWEVELAVIIGRKALYVSEENANNHIAGYAIHNDYSERAYQIEHSGQWVKGKSFDSFAPIGPYLVTPDEISDLS